ncbi:hypothetical protein PR001_g9562 [Phytophthora rubi]|nr:hypothetical protein PR001_g9562 [Phytophthora rubi]
MGGELAEAIETMTSGHDSFALLLAHEYTDRSIAGFGSRALKGVDRERFLALEEANRSVAAEKKLQFHIAKLHYHVNFYHFGSILGRYGVECREEKVAWYTLGGESLGLGDEVKLKFNFLNPAMETQSQFWQKPYGSSDSNGYLGNEGPEKDSVYSRFAIVAWPAVDNVEFTMKFASLGTAFETLRVQRPVDTATLLKFMDLAITKLADIDNLLAERRKLDVWNGSYKFPPLISTATCQVLCQLLQECGNSTLVSVFFSNFFSRVKEKHAVVLDIAKLVRKFAWGVIGKALLEAPICVDWNQDDIYVMQTTLAVVRALERGQAQQDLLSFAVGKAESLPDDRLISSRSLEELWRLVLSDSDDGILSTLSRKFERMNPRLSAPAVEIFSRYLKR